MITRRHIAGAAIIVVGLAVFATVGDPAAGVDNAPTADWISALLVIAVTCIALMLLGHRGGMGTKAAVFGATAGVLYGLSATLMKPVMETWNDDGLSELLAGWQFWVMAAAGLVGFYLQQVSLATGRLVTSVATVSVVNPVVSVLLGALVLQERLDKTPEWHAVVAIGGLATALLGAVIIATVSEGPTEPEPEQSGVRLAVS